MADSDLELVIERVFDAPRDLVFRMWSDPDHFRNWAAPTGYSVVHLEMEFEVGGIYRVCLRSLDGDDVWIKGRYREISVPERFVLTTGWEQVDGSVQGETLLTVSFSDAGEQTRVVLRQTGFESPESLDGNTGGWNEVLDSLGEYLSSNL